MDFSIRFLDVHYNETTLYHQVFDEKNNYFVHVNKMHFAYLGPDSICGLISLAGWGIMWPGGRGGPAPGLWSGSDRTSTRSFSKSASVSRPDSGPGVGPPAPPAAGLGPGTDLPPGGCWWICRLCSNFSWRWTSPIMTRGESIFRTIFKWEVLIQKLKNTKSSIVERFQRTQKNKYINNFIKH